MSTTAQRRTALVTGASSGIGAEFARTLAARHVDLVLVARSTRALNDLAHQLRSQHDVRVEIFTTDLSREGAGQQVAQHVRQLRMTIDLLVNNAGFATQGRFETIDPDLDRPGEASVQAVTVAEASGGLTVRAFSLLPIRRRGGGFGAEQTSLRAAGFDPSAHTVETVCGTSTAASAGEGPSSAMELEVEFVKPSDATASGQALLIDYSVGGRHVQCAGRSG